jgi:prenyltransferase beta subunit
MLKEQENNVVWDTAHLAMTYCALLILLILGDDLSKIDRKGSHSSE